MKIKSITTLYFLVVLSTAATLAIVSCSKKSDNVATCSDGIKNGNETGIDCGGSCAPCPTCSDGLQNGDETGVDCGGSCANVCVSTNVCSGNGQNAYLPLANNNLWIYNRIGFPTDSFHVVGTSVFNTKTYFHIWRTQNPATDTLNLYFRYDSVGDIYQYYDVLNTEYLEIPSSPFVTQTWPVAGGNTYTVFATTSSCTTPWCAYTSCTRLDVKDSGGNFLYSLYYKKGVGLVQTYFGATIQAENLKAIKLY